MYIEFKLPTAGKGAGSTLFRVKAAIEQWSRQHNISYTSKTVKWTHRLCFDNDKLYTFFAVTWNPTIEIPQWRIVSDLNNKT